MINMFFSLKLRIEKRNHKNSNSAIKKNVFIKRQILKEKESR